MATHSTVLAWEIPKMRSLVGYSPWGGKSQTRLSNSTSTSSTLFNYMEENICFPVHQQILEAGGAFSL